MHLDIPGRAKREPGISRFPDVHCTSEVWSFGPSPMRNCASENDGRGVRMILPALFFYLFAGICVASAVMVVVSRNPVDPVLFLIPAFVHPSGLFVLVGAAFLAMILV